MYPDNLCSYMQYEVYIRPDLSIYSLQFLLEGADKSEIIPRINQSRRICATGYRCRILSRRPLDTRDNHWNESVGCFGRTKAGATFTSPSIFLCLIHSTPPKEHNGGKLDAKRVVPRIARRYPEAGWWAGMN